MEKAKQVGGSSSTSSSFTMDLFGPKDSSSRSSSSSSTVFGSVFGPHSTGLSTRKHDLGSQYGSDRYGTSDYVTPRSRGENSGIVGNNRNSTYQNEPNEPCYFSSSIYYGGQEVYSSTSQTTKPQHVFKKDADDDPNGNNSNCASRGNWWQGSLYY